MKPQAGSLVISEMQVVTKATTTAADLLGLDTCTLACVMGVSETAICRMRCLDHLLEKGSEPLERSLMLIRLFRRVNAMTAGDPASVRSWLRDHDETLGCIPAQKILTAEGLAAVLAHLEAHTAPS